MHDLALDTALVATSCAYALWLGEHKELEPDWTWVEVSIGVGYCLIHAYARGRRGANDWDTNDWRAGQLQVLRSLALGSIPIVAGEIVQWLRRRQLRRQYRPYRGEE